MMSAQNLKEAMEKQEEKRKRMAEQWETEAK